MQYRTAPYKQRDYRQDREARAATADCMRVRPSWAARDLTIGVPVAGEPFHAAWERQPRASLWIAGSLSLRAHAAVVKTPLTAAHRARRASEGRGNAVLIDQT